MEHTQNDIEIILSHRYDLGADYWTNEEHNLIKGAPFTTLECASYLMELGMDVHDPLLQDVAELIFSTQREDGRFKVSPKGGIYPCHTALALQALCCMGCANDKRLEKTFQYFLDTQQEDGGWKCLKYSFGRGEETQYSTPLTTLLVVDAFRYHKEMEEAMDKAVEFLLQHWTIKKPISPCYYGIGKLFKQVEYPFRGYNIFQYVYILSYYEKARRDERFLEALALLESKHGENGIIIERVVPKLAKLSFCRKQESSPQAERRYQEIMNHMKK